MSISPDSNDQDEERALNVESIDDDAGGLFGSGSEDEDSDAQNVSSKRRKLDDAELDSGDDEGRFDRVLEDQGGEELQKDNAPEVETEVIDVSIGRHPGPRPSDGELYLLQFPNHIGIDPKDFSLQTFVPPATDHHSSGPPSSTFSAYSTSNNTIRWRKSPSSSNVIQSNARINRWSDGSLTLQLASNAHEQFELAAKPLAQPQVNPIKPTPTGVSQGRPGAKTYDSRLDSHTYLGAPHEHAGIIRHTHHITASLAVQSSDQDDDALLRLEQSLAAATKGSKVSADGGVQLINITEDPENNKRRAEMAEKEKSKMQRRLQAQQDRETTRSNNILKKSGLRTSGIGGGLTVGGLEDDDGMTVTKGRMPKSKSRKSRRRNSDYSEDEEDFRGRGRMREDEYDEDDGFLVGSDEEPDVGEESEEEGEMDAEGDDDEEVLLEKSKKVENDEITAGVRVKRRRVIEDEED